MKRTVTKWAVTAVGAGAMALLLATPSFAQSRGDSSRNGGNYERGRQSDDSRGRGRDNRGNRQYDRNHTPDNNSHGYRENQRVTMSGRISSVRRERDGYRLQLDRGGNYWVPQSAFGRRARDLRAGISISLGGIFRRGMIVVDAVSWPGSYGAANGAYGREDGVLRGVVERVDYRSGTIWLRDEASGQLIDAETGRGGYGRSDVGGLQRGDYVELSGHWDRGGSFDTASIDVLRDHRY